MSAPKFTQGPWKVYGRGYKEILADYADNFPIITASDNGLSFYRPQDGQLCAAAPDLYEALQMYVNWFNREGDTLTEILIEINEKAEAALAKARGE